MSGATEGLARSVHTRLIQHAKRTGLDPTLVLTRYGIEPRRLVLGGRPVLRAETIQDYLYFGT